MSDHAKRITPQALAALAHAGNVTILDMRREWDTADTKIPGAIRVHPDAFATYTGSLPDGRPVVTYCT